MVRLGRFIHCLAFISQFFAPSRVTAEDAMTMEFSFRGARGCVTLFPNPEIRFKNLPSGARWVLLRLSQGTRDLGGQEVAIPASGILPFDTVRTYAPCNAGDYTYEAIVKSSQGQVLSQIRKSRAFPEP